jgi:hypothetical protein
MSAAERLYRLLPAFYRERDQQQGEPLRALLALLERELDLLADDVEQLYDDLFIETCAEWVVPYIGDLLGVPVIGEQPPAQAGRRSQVANTLAYRRRKGTPAVLERVIPDSVGFYARAVELFRFLAFQQTVRQPRPGKGGLFDVRDREAFAPVGTPFEEEKIFRTADVRRIASRRGRYNVPNLALFLWRLATYRMKRRAARALLLPADGRYLADPLGRDLPLFNRPRQNEDAGRQSAEHHLPVLLRNAALAADLADFQSRHLALPPGERPAASEYYGPGRALELYRDGVLVPPMDLVAWDLESWRRPPTGILVAGVPAVLSEPVASFAELSAAMPALTALLGTPRLARLAGVPADLAAAATLLQQAIRAADPAAPRFAGARVEVIESRLLASSGIAGQALVFRATAADATTVSQLRLGLAEGRLVGGIFSGPLDPFPAFPPPQLAIELGGVARVLSLGGIPPDLETLRAALQGAIRAAAPALPVFANARVARIGDQLLVSPGVAGTPVSFGPTPADPGTAAALGLTRPPAVVVDGLYSGILFPFPRLTRPRLTVTLGGASALAELEGVPADLASTAALLQAAIRAAAPSPDPGGTFANAVVLALADRLLVRPGNLGDAVSFGLAGGDFLTFRELALGALAPVDGLLSGILSPFPAISRPQLRLTLAGSTVTVPLGGLPTGVASAAAVLEAAIRAAVPAPDPGGAFAGARVVALGDRLLVRSGAAGQVAFFAATAADATTTPELGLSGGQAVAEEGLLSGPLSPFPALTRPRLAVQVAGETHALELPGAPADLASAAALVQAALRAIDPARPLFAAAIVQVLDDRLWVQAGIAGESISFLAGPADAATLSELALAAPPAQSLGGLLSAPLSPFPTLDRPRIQWTIGATTAVAQLADLPASLADARGRLEAAIRAAHSSPAFSAAVVEQLGNRLLVRPGAAAAIAAAAAPGDATTAGELGLTGVGARTLDGFFSPPFPAMLNLPQPQLAVTIGATTANAALTTLPRSLPDLRQALQNAVRGADPAAGFRDAEVLPIDRRLWIVAGAGATVAGVAATPADTTTAAELRLDAAGADPLTAFVSAPVSPFPLLAAPELEASFGATTVIVRLAGAQPATLDEARAFLEARLRSASPAATFTGARVARAGDRLVVLPGVAADAVSFATTGADTSTRGDLALGGSSAAVSAFLSGSLPASLTLTSPQRRVLLTLGATGPETVTLATSPTTPAAAATALQEAIRDAAPAADPGGAFANALVALVDSRLLVLAGAPGATPVFAASGADPTFGQLELDAGNTSAGRRSGNLPAFAGLSFPKPALTIEAGGASQVRELAGAPRDLAEAGAFLESALRTLDAGATALLLGSRLVAKPALPNAIGFGPAPADFVTVAELRLTGFLSSRLPSPLVLSSASPQLQVTLGSDTRLARLMGAPPADPATAAARLETAIRTATTEPPTPIPAAFANARVVAVADQLLVIPGAGANGVAFAASPMDASTFRELGLRGPSEMGFHRGWLSGELPDPLPILTRGPGLAVTLGGVTRSANLEAVPATLGSAASVLQAAIRAAPGPASASFQNAEVLALGDRFFVQSGIAGENVAFANLGGGRPPTATGLFLNSLTAARGLLSGELPAIPVLSIAPAVLADFGGTAATAVLGTVPADLATARSALEAALRAAHPAFAGVQVEVAGTRLLIRPPSPGSSVSFAEAPGGPASAAALGLLPPGARQAGGLLSGPLAPFPALSARPRFSLKLGGTSRTIVPAGLPADLFGAAGQLQAAIRLHPGVSFTAARVDALGNRLRIRSGTAGESVEAANLAGAPPTAGELRLDAAQAEPAAGLLSATLPATFQLTRAPSLTAQLGGLSRPVALTAIPADLQGAAAILEASLRQADAASPAFAFARAERVGDRLLVRSGTGGAVAFAAPGGGRPDTAAELALDAGVAQAADGVLSGPLPTRPLLTQAPALRVSLGSAAQDAFLSAFPGDLASAASLLQQAIRQAAGGPSFAGATVVPAGNRLWLRSGVAGEIAAVAETPAGPNTAAELRLDPASSQRADGLLSADLSGSLGLALGLQLEATLGAAGTRNVRLVAVPSSLEEARNLLQAGLRMADPSPEFAYARVGVIGERLLVETGVLGASIEIANAPGDATASRLALDTAQARPADGLLSGSLQLFPSLAAPLPELALTIEEPRLSTLSGAPAGGGEAAQLLEAGLRNAAPPGGATFAAARVTFAGQQLVVLPGVDGDTVAFGPAPADPSSAGRLQLDGARLRPATVLLSAPLAPFPALASSAPALALTLDARTAIVRLGAVPRSLEEARALLSSAIRASRPDDAAFAGAAVGLAGNSLLLLPGRPVTALAVAATAGDPDTAAELGLDAGAARLVLGAASGSLGSFPALGAAEPRLVVELGSERRSIVLGGKPANLEEARALLEAAVRRAGASPAFAGTTVALAGKSLLAIGGAGRRIRFAPAPEDGRTVVELGLRHRVAIDAERGRVAFAVGDQPLGAEPGAAAMTWHYGFSGDIGGGPYDRRATLATAGDAWTAEVAAGGAFTSLAAALAAWPRATRRRALVRLLESATYAEPLPAIELADGDQLILEAADGVLPVLIGDLRIDGGGRDCRCELSGLLIDGSLELRGSLQLVVRHSTLVPRPLRDSLFYGGGDPHHLRVELEAAITGALRLPAEAVALEIADSLVGALPSLPPVEVSGSLATFSGFSAPAPELAASLGPGGARTVAIGGAPASPATARDALRDALRSTAALPGFAGAEVLLRRDRLIVLSGDEGAVSLEATGRDPTTATQLRLDPGSGRHARAAVSRILSPFPAFTAAGPELAVTAIGPGGRRGPFVLRLDPPPATVAQARDLLENALRAADPDPAFAAALVGSFDSRLVAVPGSEATSLLFAPTPTDATSFWQLGLPGFGPPATIERTTVFGPAFLRELQLADAALFTEPLVAERRHLGGARFSYFPEGSETPLRFRCQPDLQVARALSGDLAPGEAALARRRALAGLHLAFGSTRYGDPAFGQLAGSTSAAIAAGAEDGSEMGAFSRLRQPLRLAQLQDLIDEYGRFGLEAGVFHVT